MQGEQSTKMPTTPCLPGHGQLTSELEHLHLASRQATKQKEAFAFTKSSCLGPSPLGQWPRWGHTVAGLDDLRGLAQPKQFYASMI